MFNSPHPGEILADLWLEPMELSLTRTAQLLNVSRKAISQLVNGKPALASKWQCAWRAFGKSAESWLASQAAYDVWLLDAKRDSLGVKQHAQAV